MQQVDALVKRHIWAVREREHDYCGQKIALEREHGVRLSVPKHKRGPGYTWRSVFRFNRFVEVVQTDGGSDCVTVASIAHIESFNRTLRKECLWGKFKSEDAVRLPSGGFSGALPLSSPSFGFCANATAT